MIPFLMLMATQKFDPHTAMAPRTQAKNPARVNQLKDLKTTTVKVGAHTFKCWVMDNDSKRAEGMMFLTDKEVKAKEGMLFVFDKDRPQGFWMHNTLIGLDVAYIRKDGTIVTVKTGKPLDDTSLPSEAPAMYVLEVKAGTLKKLGIKKGMKAKIDAKLKGGP